MRRGCPPGSSRCACSRASRARGRSFGSGIAASFRWRGSSSAAGRPRSGSPCSRSDEHEADALPSLTILMPVYNESKTVLAAIEDALGADLPVDTLELIVIDDGSTDGTTELLRSAELPDEVVVVHQPRNAGKGAAVRTG